MMQRSYLQEISKRIHEPRKFIQVLYGPRQVGKTTLIKQLLETTETKNLFVTADDTIGTDAAWLRSIWAQARLQLKQSEAPELILVIDEIQKITNWSETVKKEWDMDTFENRPIKVILLGSSSLLIQKGLTESLAGRFETIPIPHWSFSEMQEAFGWTLDQYVWFGGYPGSASLIQEEKRWKNYIKNSLIETSISKDVLLLTRVDKPALLKRLFEIGCNYSAQILSLTKIQGELMEKGNITTLSNYLDLLQSAGLLGSIEKYAGDIIRKRSSKPKFQVFNNALISAQSEYEFQEVRANHKEWGRFVESAVGAHLINSAITNGFNLYYWNENSKEVDFILERGSKMIAIEVKSGKDSFNEGLSIFEKAYHPYALYTVGTDGIPLETFLRTNIDDLF